VHYVEATAPPDARIAWVGGDFLKGELDVEEGIHFQWHLQNRGRGDVRVGLVDASGQPVKRVELPPLDGPADLRVASQPAAEGWEKERSFVAAYWLGRRQYSFEIDRPAARMAAAQPTLNMVNQLFQADADQAFRAATGLFPLPPAAREP
jgi:hypothetical protein